MKHRMMRTHRGGFSLIEIVVTIVLLSVVLLALAPVLLQAVSRQRTDAIQLEQNGVLLSEANRLLAIPFGQLDVQTDITIDEPYAFEYEVEIDVTGSPGPQRHVKVKVTPSGGTVGPDSIQFSRTQP